MYNSMPTNTHAMTAAPHGDEYPAGLINDHDDVLRFPQFMK